MAVNLIDVEQFMIDTIKTEFPSIDYREGTGFRDLFIKPNALILQSLADEIDTIRQNQSINNAPNMSEDEFDALMANIFVTRRTGQKSTGTVRLLFSETQAVTIASGTLFTSADGLEFITRQSFSFTAEQMALNVLGSFYYVVVNVQSTGFGSDYNIAAGDIVSISGGPTGVVSVENPSAFTGGQRRETNQELALRARFAITVRDLNTEPAIKHILLEQFESLLDVQSIGFGDPEMIRDVLTGQDLELGDLVIGDADEVNIGGKVDIYLNPVTRETKSIDVPNAQQTIILRPYNASIDGPAPPANTSFVTSIVRPVITITSIEEINVTDGTPTGRVLIEGVDYEWVVDAPSLTYSIEERTRLRLLTDVTGGSTGGNIYIGARLRINYQTSGDVATVQAFITSRTQRIVNADLLAKHAIPAYVSFVVNYESSSSNPLTESVARTAIENALQGLGFAGELQVSDIISLMYENGADYVEPFIITVSLRDVYGVTRITTSDVEVSVGRNTIFIPGTIVINKL